jgi:BirA family biotin operon repressor/biotin-[acetyl-CoA-carboxylase] ligase
MITDGVRTWTDAVRPGGRIGHAIEAYESVGSTNDRARTLLDEGIDGVAVVAEEQTAGRGRRGRSWTSPPGRNLTASIGVELRLDAADAWQLGLAAALALRDACSTVAATRVDLKWPNDLVAPDGAKVGGLLVETAIDGNLVRSAVIGFGINVNWRRAEMPSELAASATSLAELAGAEVDRVALLRSALAHVEQELDQLDAGQSPLERYRAACATIGAAVTVETSEGPVDGRAVDLDDHGALVVETGSGERVTISSGEVVRVRGSAS